MYETNAARADYATATAGVPTARITEVQGEIDGIGKTMDYLAQGLDELESKLNPVLAQRSTETDAQTKQPEALRVPLADVLHLQGTRLDQLRQRVASMISRLEL